MKRLILILLAVLSVPALPRTASAQAQPDTVVLAFSRQPDFLFPDYAVTSTAGFAMRVLYNALVKAGPDGKLVGDLAASWEVSADKLTWTFKLRPDAKWHDGQPVTADDVKYSFTFPADKDYTGLASDVALALKGAQEYKDGKAKTIEGIKVIDDHTVSLTTLIPSALFLNLQGARYILPAHVLQSVPVKDLATSSQARSPIGTGPYKLVAWKTDESITYTRFDDYYADKAKIKNYIWKIIPEQSVQITELLGGTVDIVPEVLPDDFGDLKTNTAVKTLQLPGVNFTMLQLNQKNPLFADVRVRQAISYAIDKQSIIKAVGGGFGIEVTSIVHPSLPEYNKDLKGYPFNLAKAKALLAEVGWTDANSDGVLKAKGVKGVADGTKFSVEMGTFNRPLYQNQVQIIQQNLKIVGIETAIKVVDFNTYFSDYLTGTSNYQIGISGWFAFEQIPQGELLGNFGKDQPQNWVHWASTDEFEKILKDAPTEFDADKRNKLYWRAEEILEQEAVWVNLTRLDNLIAYSSKLKVPDVKSQSALFSSVGQWEWVK